MRERHDARATLAKRRQDVAEMFDHVARRYDLVNDIGSLWQVRLWRQEVLQAVDPQPGQRILDLAAGTGTSSLPFAQRGADVFPTDLSLGMLAEGKRRLPALQFVAADALSLPYADKSFDAATISFGLRNIDNTHAALAELLRVTKPGGNLVVCEFSTPTWAPFRATYRGYLDKVMRPLAKVTASNPVAYDYLVESILSWPNQQALADIMYEAGWRNVEWRNLTGGIVALHRAHREADR